MARNFQGASSTAYSDSHRDRGNLLIHLAAVPLFIVGTLWLALSILQPNPSSLAAALAAIGVSMAAQGIGHRRECQPPEPFNGPRDFLTRVLIEQFVTFPGFVLSGRWWANWKAAAAPRT